MKTAALAAFLLLAACGRVGDPRPPIIRIAQKIDNISAVQSGYKVFLSWTNPSKYVDNNPITDLGVVHIFRNNVEVGMVAATAAGQPQSYPMDVTNSVGSPLIFTIQMVLPKANKPSPVSKAVPITPVDVPGRPGLPRSTVDKLAIVLEWSPPELNARLVEGYIVQRSDKASSFVPVPRFQDTEYEAGKTYVYTVTAVTGTSPQIPGEGNRTLEVVAKDTTPPLIPSGLTIQLVGPAAFPQWTENTEPDLKGYQLFRSDRPDVPIYTGIANGYADPDYVPGKGLTYELLAEDIFGNKSKRSAPTPGP